MSSAPSGILGYCRACGKALDATNMVTSQGTIYCKEHAPMDTTAQSGGFAQSPYTAPIYSGPSTPPPIGNPDVSPGLAFILGCIPGVGAIYNGQYAKGLVHVVIVGLMISLLANGSMNGLEVLMSFMIAAFWAYMCFEAYHTAKMRRMGLVVDEFSSLIPLKGSSFPMAPIVLIGLGIIFLLNNLELFELRRAMKYWPVLLIVLGVYMLYARYGGSNGAAAGPSSGSPLGKDQ
jgi:hypothetical protein